MPIAPQGGIMSGLQSGMGMALDVVRMKREQERMEWMMEQDRINQARQRALDLEQAVGAFRDFQRKALTPETRNEFLEGIGRQQERFGEAWPKDLRVGAWAPYGPTDPSNPESFTAPNLDPLRAEGYGSESLKAADQVAKFTESQAVALTKAGPVAQEALRRVVSSPSPSFALMQERQRLTDAFGPDVAKAYTDGIDTMISNDSQKRFKIAELTGKMEEWRSDEMGKLRLLVTSMTAAEAGIPVTPDMTDEQMSALLAGSSPDALAKRNRIWEEASTLIGQPMADGSDRPMNHGDAYNAVLGHLGGMGENAVVPRWDLKPGSEFQNDATPAWMQKEIQQITENEPDATVTVRDGRLFKVVVDKAGKPTVYEVDPPDEQEPVGPADQEAKPREQAPAAQRTPPEQSPYGQLPNERQTYGFMSQLGWEDDGGILRKRLPLMGPTSFFGGR